MASDPAGDRLSQGFSKAYLDSLEELLGENGAKVVYKVAKLELPEARQDSPSETLSLDDFSALQLGLAQIYGEKGSLSIGRKSGRMTLEKLLPSQAGLAQDDRSDFESLSQLIDFINLQLGDVRVMVSTIETEIGIILDPCPECRSRESDHPICYAMLGFLEAAISCVNSTPYTSVVERACQGAGQPHCEFLIS